METAAENLGMIVASAAIMTAWIEHRALDLKSGDPEFKSSSEHQPAFQVHGLDCDCTKVAGLRPARWD